MNNPFQFHYSPYTGNQLIPQADGHFKDSVTGQSVYLNPKPTAAAIIEDGNKQILLAQRKYEPGKEMWDLPGGFLDLNETIELGLKRELNEELGVAVARLKYFGSAHTTYEYEGVTYPILDSCFIVTLADEINEFEIGDDVLAVKWVSYHTIDYSELHGESIKQFIKSYFEHI
ncbi:TPA: NUDIX domain-containing protein [Candidatus Saccharibacteria bacterium]|nr:NUDIX domain-containing protein [Candidatus Saccharibacteria bacterium]HIO87995.1 NUDIX domain-containing protein [Candidatus Saccharibacteria bacterium]